MPVHIATETGATDYVWEKHARYNRMVEGFGYGRMDSEGFNNLRGYSGAQFADVLIMGSSHMEGLNLPQGKTAAALLNALFGGSKLVYNIGISGHDFPRIANNIDAAAQYCKPGGYIVIETDSVRFDVRYLEDGADGALAKIPSYDSGMLLLLQKIPYLRLVYSQYGQLAGNAEEGGGREPETGQGESVYGADRHSTALDAAMGRLHRAAMEHGCKIIVFYHPHLVLSGDTSVSENTDREFLGMFENACRRNGIEFMDMTERFVEEYEERHVLPHGFSNTAAGVGHLNKDGHRLIADELFRRISTLEGGRQGR
ncbi:MAG: hypothetical protein LBS32_02840 [Clostridiales Family XIII bacterium]|nr:hypothetical protein [Clostridiales Family XIII bacterium]